MTHLLLVLSVIGSFNQAGDLEAHICHTDEPRREPKYLNETSVCFGLRKVIDETFEENKISPAEEETTKPNARNILKSQFKIRSPYVTDPYNDSFTDEEMKTQLAIQAALKNPLILNKKVQ